MNTVKPEQENIVVKPSAIIAGRGSSAGLAKWQPVRILVLLTLVVRLLTMPSFVESGDGWYFVRGVTRYATFELRPHWPGYPVYIWAGQLFSIITPDPVLGLHLLAVFVSSLSIFPIAALAGEWRRAAGGTAQQAQLAALSAGLIWALIPLAWLTGSEIYSDGLGLLLALLVLWLSWLVLTEKAAAHWLAVAALLGGLMVGVRLSYFILLLPLIYVGWRRRKLRLARLSVFTVSSIVLLLTCASWFGWQLAQEGTRFFAAADRHLSGHYNSWGGSIFTDTDWLSRPVRLLELTLVYGFGGWWPGTPLLGLPVLLLLVGLVFNGARRLPKQVVIIVVLWVLPYTVWVLISHDLTIARYSLPVVALAVIIAANGLPSGVRQSYSMLAAAVLVLAVVTVPLAMQHRASPPIGQQLADYTKAKLNSTQIVILISQKVAAVNFANLFLLENVPDALIITTEQADFDQQASQYAAQGRQIYAVWPDKNAPAKWHLVTNFVQPRFLDSLTDLNGLNEVWFYRYEVSGY